MQGKLRALGACMPCAELYLASFLAAAICGGMAYGAHRLLSIRPEEVFRVALKHVKTNEQVRVRALDTAQCRHVLRWCGVQVHRALGMDVVSGKLRAYKLDGKAFASKNGCAHCAGQVGGQAALR